MRGHGWFSKLSSTQKLRRGVAALGAVAILTPVCLTLANAETSQIANRVLVSKFVSRADAHVLDNTRVDGVAAVFFVGDELTRRVEFFLDDGDFLNKPKNTEYFAPFDFIRTQPDNAPAMFDFSSLKPGIHSMSLKITNATDDSETAFETRNAYSIFYVGVDPPSNKPTTPTTVAPAATVPVVIAAPTTVPATTTPPTTVPVVTVPATTTVPVVTVPATTTPPVVTVPVTTTPRAAVVSSGDAYVQAGPTVSITAHGAAANDGGDDSAGIQAAIDAVRAQGGGTVFFPAGEYIANEVNVYPGISYVGNGDALLKRSANFGDHSMLFTSGHYLYSGNVDSKPMVFRGLILDGNSQQQGPYRSYQKEHSHLLYLDADASRAGRLKVDIANMRFQNAVGDGIEVYRNVDVKVDNSSAHDVFRGGYVMTGGYSIGHVTNFKTTGDRDPTGIDMEIDAVGYGNTMRVELYMSNLDLDADFDLGLSDGSFAEIRNVVTHDGGFFISNQGNGTVNIYDSSFAVGGADSYGNRIIYPGQLTFNNVDFKIVRQNGAASYQYGLDVYGMINGGASVTAPQNITLHGCTFVSAVSAPDKPVVGFHMQNPFMTTINLNDTSFGAGVTPVA